MVECTSGKEFRISVGIGQGRSVLCFILSDSINDHIPKLRLCIQTDEDNNFKG